MSDSGPPAHWPFTKFDPTTFHIPTRRVTRVFLHCTASDNRALVGVGLVEEINRWHIQNGWRGVGYHFLIDKEGSVMTARAIEETPAAQLGPDNMGNVATIAFSVHGLWDFTTASLQSAVAMCKSIDAAYKTAGKPVTFHGHKELDPRPCPVFDYKSLLGLDAKGNLFTQPFSLPAIVAEKATVAKKLEHPEG